MITLPKEIISISQTLGKNGYQSFLVGGCVRDLSLGLTPKDWDMTSDCLPNIIQDLFPHSHYDNDFGTVRIVNEHATDQALRVIEITTFRQEVGYSDGRRPDQVNFSKDIRSDLERRDFTINALAYDTSQETNFDLNKITDLHGGLNDLNNKIIRTVGVADKRFGEDGLRLIRAIRFASQLDFMIESDTLESIIKNSRLLERVAIERISDEFNKLIATKSPGLGLELLYRSSLLQYFIPELLEGVDVDQNQAHLYTVWEHSIRTLQAAADKGFTNNIRLAALFHDIGKPETKEISSKTGEPTFYTHELVGAKITKNILVRLKYPKDDVSQITKLVRWHMFFSDPDEITLAAVRRLIAKVGPEMIWDLVNLRICDRIGTGRPKEQPYRLRKFKAMVEEASRQPTSPKMLNINGNDLIDNLKLAPGGIIGDLMAAFMYLVLEDPSLNSKVILLDKAKSWLENKDILKEYALKGREAIRNRENDEIYTIRNKHNVK